MAQGLSIPSLVARRFLLRATGLAGLFSSIDVALAHLGFVQIDPINVCGRMQDHILRHRVVGYREHDLMSHLHRIGERTAFEHHLPDSQNLAALPLEAWPHLQRAMHARAQGDSVWSGQLTGEEKRFAKSLLGRIAEEGSLCSQDFLSERKAKQHAWDSTTLAKSTLQKLFFHGRVLIAKREANRRYYDLPEKVLPASTLASPTPTEAQTQHWLAQLKLRQRRLAVLKATELRLLHDEVVPATLADRASPKLHVLRSDLPLLETSDASETALLIAPLDPIIYDRRVTEAVWNYDYRWEVYVPPQKRVRGYYALPLLNRDAFIGHMDCKADRDSGHLRLLTQLESTTGVHRIALKSLAEFLGLESLL